MGKGSTTKHIRKCKSWRRHKARERRLKAGYVPHYPGHQVIEHVIRRPVSRRSYW